MKRCLVADGSEIVRKVARTFIERLGFEVIEADSGPEAIAAYDKQPPDVILLDWHLPETTTIEFLSMLRLQSGGKRSFVIYCTTDNDPADITRAFTAGADAYLIKPFDREAIVAKFAETGLAA